MPSNSLSSVSQDQYLQLLVAQLQNQNPLDPVSDKELVAQLAQFSTLEGITQLNANFGDLLQLQQITQGNSLLGRKVTYADASTNALLSGIVSGVAVDQGNISLRIGNTKVPISQVREVEQIAA